MIPINFSPSSALFSLCGERTANWKATDVKKRPYWQLNKSFKSPGPEQFICSYHCIYTEIYGYLIIVRGKGRLDRGEKRFSH